MKTIIVGFSSHPSLFSSLIRWITNSKASHTYVRIPVPEYNEQIVFQASGLLVNYMNFRVFKLKNKIIEEYEIEVTNDVYDFSEMLRVMEVGKPYSIKEIFGLLYILIMRGFGIKVNNPFRDGSASYVCVELVMMCVDLKADSENVTQEDFRRWCAKNGKLIYKNPI